MSTDLVKRLRAVPFVGFTLQGHHGHEDPGICQEAADLIEEQERCMSRTLAIMAAVLAADPAIRAIREQDHFEAEVQQLTGRSSRSASRLRKRLDKLGDWAREDWLIRTKQGWPSEAARKLALFRKLRPY